VCLPTFPLVPVLRRLLPTVYCLPTFLLVTCPRPASIQGNRGGHSSLVTAFRKEEAADLFRSARLDAAGPGLAQVRLADSGSSAISGGG